MCRNYKCIFSTNFAKNISFVHRFILLLVSLAKVTFIVESISKLLCYIGQFIFIYTNIIILIIIVL